MAQIDDQAWGPMLMSVKERSRPSALGLVIGLVIIAALGPVIWAVVGLGVALGIVLNTLLGRRKVEALYETGVLFKRRWSYDFVPWTELKIVKVDRRRLFSVSPRLRRELADRHGSLDCTDGPALQLAATCIEQWAPISGSARAASRQR